MIIIIIINLSDPSLSESDCNVRPKSFDPLLNAIWKPDSQAAGPDTRPRALGPATGPKSPGSVCKSKPKSLGLAASPNPKTLGPDTRSKSLGSYHQTQKS